MDQAGRVALVTGGGRGIGKAIALGLAADGADIAINYRKNDEAAAETIAQPQALAFASGMPRISAIGRMTTSPTPNTQASALCPPSARETRASSTEMLPQVTAVIVARRMPMNMWLSASPRPARRL